jgi:predicted GIY-YIG superfamily endonuclease
MKHKKSDISKQLKSKLNSAKINMQKRKIISHYEDSYFLPNIERVYFKPCIYFLHCRNEVVYVGETKSLLSRITQHINENTKIFNAVSFRVYEGNDKERRMEEKKLIELMKPYYNIVHNK